MTSSSVAPDDDTRTTAMAAPITSDGDTSTTAANAPAGSSRRDKVQGFDYTSRPTTHTLLFQGLGIVKKEDEQAIKADLTDFIKLYHPHYVFETGIFTERNLKGKLREKLCKKMYKRTPSFCSVPDEYQDYAMSKLLTDLVSFRIKKRSTTKGSKDTEVVNSRSRGRDAVSGSESDSTDTKPSKRIKVKDERSDTGTLARRSYDRITPIMEYRYPLPNINIRESMVFFHAVEDGKLGRKITKVHASELGSDLYIIDWSMLVKEASAAEDEGFHYNTRLYLSPRCDQELAIRTQATLTSALQDMKTTNLIFTTSPVDSNVKMEDAPLATSFIDPLGDSIKLQEPQQTFNPMETPEVRHSSVPQQPHPSAVSAGDAKAAVDSQKEQGAKATHEQQQDPPLRSISRPQILAKADMLAGAKQEANETESAPPRPPSSTTEGLKQAVSVPKPLGPGPLESSPESPSESSVERSPESIKREMDWLAEYMKHFPQRQAAANNGLQAVPNSGLQAVPNNGLQAAANNGLQAARNSSLQATRNSGLQATSNNLPQSTPQTLRSSSHTSLSATRAKRSSANKRAGDQTDCSNNDSDKPVKTSRRKTWSIQNSDTDDDSYSPREKPVRKYASKDYDPDSDLDDAPFDPDVDDEGLLLTLEGDSEGRHEQAAADATRYALTLPATKTAYAKALKEDPNVWRRGADTFLVGMGDLQNPKRFPNNRILLKPAVGLNSKCGLYGHQISGSTEMYCNIFGPRGSMIQGDEMGLGKTAMVMLTWDMNFRAVAQTNNAKVVANTHRERNPLHWPVLEDGKLHGCAPKVGALFISAPPNGIEVWVKTFVEMFTGDASHTSLEDKWKPKLVILHSDGLKLAEAYGGAEKGIFSCMDRDQWAEILPKPNWDNARIAHGHPQWPQDYRMGWAGDSDWTSHPAATATKPSPTSTRYVIVSTNQSWKSNVGHYVVDEDLPPKELRAIRNELARIPPVNTKKIRDKETEISKLRDKRLQATPRAAWKRDGAQPMQATRYRYYKTTSSESSPQVRVPEVVDLRYASFIVVDELHNAASAETITYRQIIDPTIVGCGRGRAPGILGITGTALYNGAGLIMTFAQKVCFKVADSKSDDPGVKALLSVKDVDFDATWKSVHEVYLKMSDNAKERDNKLKELPNVNSFHKAFATMLEFYLIARDSNSKNPWGEFLTILKVGLTVTHRHVIHRPDMWLKIKQAQAKVTAFQKSVHEEHLAEWRIRGCPQDQKPMMPTMARANPNAYMVARTVSCFPNLLDAIENWRVKNPIKGQVFSDPDNINLGCSNPLVVDALKSNDSVKASFIWEIAEDACRGSEKVDIVVQEIEQLQKQTTRASVMTTNGPKEVRYQSKFVVAVGIRFARMLLWAYLCKRFGPERIVNVGNKKDRVNDLPRWQRYWDTQTEQIDDGVNILVAGLKVISQSVTLTEGHVLYGFEPPTSNNDEMQYPKRQHRIGQEHDCRVVWLITVNPASPSKKAIKSNPSAESKKTIESNILGRNRTKTDFYAHVRDLESEDVIDLTNESSTHNLEGMELEMEEV